MFFVFIFEDYELSLKMIQYVTELNKKNKTIIVFNTNLLTEETKKMYVYKFSNNRSAIWFQFKKLVARIHTAIKIFNYSLIKSPRRCTVKNILQKQTIYMKIS